MTRAPLAVLALAALALPAAVLAQQPEGVTGVVEPELGRSFVVERVSGRVMVKPRGARAFLVLSGPRSLRVGSVVKATDGRVRLTVARNDSGATSRAVFSAGQFTVTEQTRERTTLQLGGPSYKDVCARGTRASASASKRRVRRLWGDGKGRFRTKGRYSAATVRGTKWLTEDRCDGTLTRVERGVVDVEDFSAPVQAPAPQPAPVIGGGDEGGGPPPPAGAPAPSRPRTVRVGSGDDYVAGPGG